MADLTCPKCDAAVPDTGASTRGGTGTPSGEINWREALQHAECPGCGASLVRNPESDLEHLQHWRING